MRLILFIMAVITAIGNGAGLAWADTTPSGPRTIRVALDGSGDFSSLQEAVDSAQKGDTVWIKAGAYAQDLTIHSKEKITIVGEGVDKVVLLGHGQMVGVLHVGKWPYGATDIEISGLTINEHGGHALGIFNGQRITLHRLRVNGMVFGQQVPIRVREAIEFRHHEVFIDHSPWNDPVPPGQHSRCRPHPDGRSVMPPFGSRFYRLNFEHKPVALAHNRHARSWRTLKLKERRTRDRLEFLPNILVPVVSIEPRPSSCLIVQHQKMLSLIGLPVPSTIVVQCERYSPLAVLLLGNPPAAMEKALI